MIRQNQVGAVADEQILVVDLDPDFAQLLDLRKERDWIDNDAVADDANFSAPQNP